MGCAPSRFDGEGTVARCRDRRHHLRGAVASRVALAAAHRGYVDALKNVGAALADYASGEGVVDGDEVRSAAVGSSASAAAAAMHVPAMEVETMLPPPPPPEHIAPANIARSVSAPDIAIPKEPTKQPSGEIQVINEEDEFADLEAEEEPQLVRKGKKAAAAAAASAVAAAAPVPAADGSMRKAKEGKKVKKLVTFVAPAPAAPILSVILHQLDVYFIKASDSAHGVSKLLEAARMHYHSNFAETRGFVDHSARVMKAITWSNSIKGLAQADKVRDDDDDDRWETLATVLDKLLAWEKKLCEEAKESEMMKLEYQRKLMLLNKRKNRGANPNSLEKTRSVVSHLHSKFVVDMQSMECTITEISRLRDHQLYPKLVQLIVGLENMWEGMYNSHRSQLQIMLEFRNFDTNATGNDSSEELYTKTIQLCNIVKGWHVQFDKLQTYQVEFVDCLYNWLKATLIPIDTSLKDKQQTPTIDTNPPIKKLLGAWHEDLQKLPPAKEAIFRFSESIQTIIIQLEEELSLKQQCEDTSRELEKQKRHFESWKSRYTERNASPEGADPVAERKSLVDALEAKLREEMQSYRKKCKHAREKSLGSFRTLLPELFRAVSDFAARSCMMYKDLLSVHQENQQPQHQSSN